ncbi:MAG: IclR family transcriptional regulator [Bacillota bacterium]
MRTKEIPPEMRVKTVERSLAILEVMAQQNTALPLTEVSKLAHLNISTTYRLLSALRNSGFVEREIITGFYRLGLKAFLIGNAVLQQMDIRKTALPYLNALMQATGESVYLAMLSGSNVIYTDAVKSPALIQPAIQTGIPIPACQTCAGKILLAGLPLQEQQVYAERYVKMALITDEQLFLDELDGLYKQGMAIDLNRVQIYEISAPVYCFSKKCAGAISIFGAAGGEGGVNQADTIPEQLLNTAKEVSQMMGYG